MSAIKASGLPLARDIRLTIETTEETSGAGMEYYMESNKVPDYNIVLDSDYPAIIAEKGYGTINAYFPIKEVQSGVFVKMIVGGTATNQIPGWARLRFRRHLQRWMRKKVRASPSTSEPPEG